jgi:hypothetical protein
MAAKRFDGRYLFLFVGSEWIPGDAEDVVAAVKPAVSEQ